MAGYDDAQVIEIMQHVALNTWTNYINEVGKTAIDFRWWRQRPTPPEHATSKRLRVPGCGAVSYNSPPIQQGFGL
jgi:hypothetical protein